MTTTARRAGYAQGHKTYAEVRAAMKLTDRALCIIGDILDRMIRPTDAPIFPKDAPLHQPNCGVVAMCMFTDRNYADTVAIFARTRSTSWAGGTYCHEYQPAATELGAELLTVDTAPRVGTLADLANSTKGKPGRIFATVRGHAIAVWDGLIFDQSFPAGATPAEHFAARRRVEYTMRRA